MTTTPRPKARSAAMSSKKGPSEGAIRGEAMLIAMGHVGSVRILEREEKRAKRELAQGGGVGLGSGRTMMKKEAKRSGPQAAQVSADTKYSSKGSTDHTRRASTESIEFVQMKKGKVERGNLHVEQDHKGQGSRAERSNVEVVIERRSLLADRQKSVSSDQLEDDDEAYDDDGEDEELAALPTTEKTGRGVRIVHEQPNCPTGYRYTDFPCWNCKKAGRRCVVSEDPSEMPCLHAGCRQTGAARCCADQRVVKASSGAGKRSRSNAAAEGSSQAYAAAKRSLEHRLRRALLEFNHAGKRKVDGKWSKEDWSPISMQLTLADRSSWQEAVDYYSLSDTTLAKDLDAYLAQLPEENSKVMKLVAKELPIQKRELEMHKEELTAFLKKATEDVSILESKLTLVNTKLQHSRRSLSDKETTPRLLSVGHVPM